MAATAKKMNFFREVQQELKKVSWTTRDELRLCTKVVILATFIFGFGIYLSDLIVRGALNSLSLLTYWIGG